MVLKSIPIVSVILFCLAGQPVQALDPFASLVLEEKLLQTSVEDSLRRFRQALAENQQNPQLGPSYPLFLKALSYIYQYYVRPIDLSVVIDAATQTLRNNSELPPAQISPLILSAAVNTLDSYSQYYDQEHFNDILKYTTGSFAGIGVSLAYEPQTQRLRIVEVLPHTPAQQAHLLPHDIIHQIDAIDVPALTFQEALNHLKGPVDSLVDLTIQRQGYPLFRVTLQRKMIEIPSYTLERLAINPTTPPDIAYIHLPYFSERLQADLQKDFHSLLPGMAGLILDLRDNPGGLLSQAIQVVDLFLPQGKHILSVYTKAHRDSVFITQEPDYSPNLPIAVLINDQTASASEIVSASLQDHKRALLFGTRTFGKGSIQNIIELTQDHFLHLTTGLYARLSGDLVECFGISPNIPFTLDRPLVFNCETQVRSRRVYTLSVSEICPEAYPQDQDDPILSCALIALRRRPHLFDYPASP